MDTTIIYNDYLSGDAKALERLMEIYGDKLTPVSYTHLTLPTKA